MCGILRVGSDNGRSEVKVAACCSKRTYRKGLVAVSCFTLFEFLKDYLSNILSGNESGVLNHNGFLRNGYNTVSTVVSSGAEKKYGELICILALSVKNAVLGCIVGVILVNENLSKVGVALNVFYVLAGDGMLDLCTLLVVEYVFNNVTVYESIKLTDRNNVCGKGDRGNVSTYECVRSDSKTCVILRIYVTERDCLNGIRVE